MGYRFSNGLDASLAALKASIAVNFLIFLPRSVRQRAMARRNAWMYFMTWSLLNADVGHESQRRMILGLHRYAVEAPAHVAIFVGTLIVEPAVANQLHVERRRIDRTGVHGNDPVPGAPGAPIGYKLNRRTRAPDSPEGGI